MDRVNNPREPLPFLKDVEEMITYHRCLLTGKNDGLTK